MGGPTERFVRSPDFASLLEHWIDLNHELAAAWSWRDCPWWYNERASVGTLAGAVWRSGGLALEEYSSPKRYGRGAYQGRADLWFQFGKQNYVAEAKQCWPGIGSRAQLSTAEIEQLLDESFRDAQRSVAEAEAPVGLVFASPYLPESEMTALPEQLVEWQSRIQSVAASDLAWLFPSAARTMRAEDGFVYPGVVLLARRKA